MTAIAYFISSHGFGHAARACAVIEAVWRRRPEARFELFTTTPRWFFEDSLRRSVGYHEVSVDVGLVQATAFEEDLPATVRRLRAFVPFSRELVEDLATAVSSLGCGLAVCDIAPLGLRVAGECGVPSLLVENFTWDWIYRSYTAEVPAMEEMAELLAAELARATRRIRTEPVCAPQPGEQIIPPVSRRRRTDRGTVRRALGIPSDDRMVVVTMGGIEWSFGAVEELDVAFAPDGRRVWLVLLGGTPEARVIAGCVQLPHRSGFFHPDLIHAADGVIGKLGYSTVAEVAAAGVPFGYVPRSGFPESPWLEAWVRENLACRRIEPDELFSARWPGSVGSVLDLPRRETPTGDGARQVARTVEEMLGGA